MTADSATRIAIAIVEWRGMFLVGRRSQGVSLAGYSEFPGGKVELGETPAAAAARECREETGLEIESLTEFATEDFQYEHGALRLHFFLGQPRDPSRTLCPPYRWVPREELGSLQFPAGNAAVLRRLGREGDVSPSK